MMATIAEKQATKKESGFWKTVRGITRELLTLRDTETPHVETVAIKRGEVIEVQAASMAEASRFAQGYTVEGRQLVVTRVGRNRYEIRAE